MDKDTLLAYFLGWKLKKTPYPVGNTQYTWIVPETSPIHEFAHCIEKENLRFDKSWLWLHAAWKPLYEKLFEINGYSNWAVKLLESMKTAMIGSNLPEAYIVLIKTLDYWMDFNELVIPPTVNE